MNKPILLYGVYVFLFLIIINIAVADSIAQRLGTSTTDSNINWIGNEQRSTFYKFTAPVNISLTNVEFLITEVTGGGTNFTVAIYSNNNTKPNTSNLLAYSQNFTSLLSINTWYNATFTNFTLRNDTTYWIGFIPLINTTGIYRLGETLGTPNITAYCDVPINITTFIGCNRIYNYGSDVNSITINLWNSLNQSVINVTAINYTGGVVSSFNISIYDINNSVYMNLGTTTGILDIDTMIGNRYSILAYSSQLANATYNVTMENFTQSIQYSAFPFNSINISSFLESTLASTNINATLLFTGSSYSYSYSLNGNSQIYSFFGDDTYSVQVIASGYATRTYVVSVANGSAQSLNIYMLPSNSSSSIGIYTRTLEDDIISGATIYIQHLINSSYTGLTQGITDGTGYIVFQLEEGKTYRMIISADNFNIFTRDLVPYSANSPYTFKLSPSSTFSYVTLTDYAKYWYSPTNSNLNGSNQTFTFTTYSVNGSIVYTYINCDGSIQNVSGSPTGSSVSVNLNYSVNDIIMCMFAMDVTGYGYYSFNVSYYSFDEVATSIKNSAIYIRNNTNNLWLTLLSYVITLLIVVGIKQSYPDTRITGVILCVGMIFFTSIGWINAVAGGVSATIGLLLLYVGSRS